MHDAIEIRRLRVSTHIGVPDEERASPQDVWLTVMMVPSQPWIGLRDDISRTIDYHQISIELEKLASSRPRKLIETLALDAADYLLGNHPLARVSITVEKKILPNTECVAVHITREAP